MHTIYAIHAPEADKLAQVIEQMRSLGAPTIEVVDCGDFYMALEGSHRLAAAAELGLAPILLIHAQDDMLDVSKYDWYDGANWAVGGEIEYLAGEVAGEMRGPQNVAYAFERVA
jgi:hypothetical protein